MLGVHNLLRPPVLPLLGNGQAERTELIGSDSKAATVRNQILVSISAPVLVVIDHDRDHDRDNDATLLRRMS